MPWMAGCGHGPVLPVSGPLFQQFGQHPHQDAYARVDVLGALRHERQRRGPASGAGSEGTRLQEKLEMAPRNVRLNKMPRGN